MVRLLIILLLSCSFALANQKSETPLDYYHLEFDKNYHPGHWRYRKGPQTPEIPFGPRKPPHALADTLFEKTVWHRKVSYLVLEERRNKFLVTLLMIQPYPTNYKSQNYPLHYEFSEMKPALEKLQSMNDELCRGTVYRIKIFGSKIISEKMVFQGKDKKSTPETCHLLNYPK